jgi:hypothetical protein
MTESAKTALYLFILYFDKERVYCYHAYLNLVCMKAVLDSNGNTNAYRDIVVIVQSCDGRPKSEWF